MSKERRETVTCPACGNVQNFIVWQSLNGDLDPEAKQQLLDGTLFRFVCSKCGCTSHVDYNILYHDMTHKAMIYYVKAEFVEQTIDAMTDAENKMGFAMSGYRKRIVTDQNTLREKAIIFEHGLDDRVIEIIKFIYLANASDSFPEAKIKTIYFLMEDDKYTLALIGDSQLSAEIPNNMYDEVKAEFAERLETADDNGFIAVDIRWAMDFLKK